MGPILSNSYPPLDEQCSPFLHRKGKVVYVAFGTHVIASPDKLERLIRGLAMALEEGSIDGVVWAMRMTARKQLDPTQTYPVSSAKGSFNLVLHDGGSAVQQAPRVVVPGLRSAASDSRSLINQGLPHSCWRIVSERSRIPRHSGDLDALLRRSDPT